MAGEKSASSATPEAAPAKADKPVRQEELTLLWQAFINTMPQAETALAQRMRIMQPLLTGEGATTAEVKAENEEVATMLTQLKPRLLPFLRERLQNAQFNLIFSVTEKTEQAIRPYDKRQQLRHLCDINPSLITLGKAFKLELV